MATAAELARPGVEVIQSVRTTSPTFLRPTLAPVVVGPAFEVITVLTTDGALNDRAKWGAYGQLGKVITQSAFPDHRGNIDELDIQEDSIRPFLYYGGKIRELPTDPGEGFLVASHVAHKAVFKVAGDNFAVGGLNLVIAVDQPVAADHTKDVTVPFPGTSAYTATNVVKALNDAFGFEVAKVTVNGSGTVTGFEILSPSYGANSSLTIRSTGTANDVFILGWDVVPETPIAKDERIEGCGYRAVNLGNNQTASTWVEFFRGEYYLGSVAAEDAAWPAKAALRPLSIMAAADVQGRHGAVTFGGSNTVPATLGDYMIADGVRVSGGEISRIDADKFRMGVVNPMLSVVDAQGGYSQKVYDDTSLGILGLSDVPFAPQYVWFKATGLQPNAAAVAANMTGTATASDPEAAEIVAPDVQNLGAVNSIMLGLRIDYTVSIDGVDNVGTFVFTKADAYADLSAVAADIEIPNATAYVVGGKLAIATVPTGSKNSISIGSTGSANPVLGLSTTADANATGVDASFASLPQKNLQFSFDLNPHVYDVSFPDASLDDAVARINATVGAVVASKDANGTKLVLTSPLAGVGSRAVIVGGTACTVFGLTASQTATNGSGRPNPDAYLDVSNNLVVNSGLLRDPVSGYPYDQATSTAQLYIEFTGLRKDVSSRAKVAGVLRIPDVATLSQILDPIDERNPLALGMYLGMINSPGLEMKGLGVDEVSGAAPEGTEVAYARAAGFLEAEEVYAIAPLTHNEVVHGLFQTHVTLMSEPEQGGERILIYNKKVPGRKSSTPVTSGAAANTTATPNQLLIDSLPQTGLVDAGVNPQSFGVDDGVYIEFSWLGVFYRYNITSVNGGTVVVNTVFTGAQNADAFYTTTALPSNIVNAAWTMLVRGPSLMIAGSNPPKLDFSQVAITVSEANGGVGNRRAYSVFPDYVKTTLGGVEKEIPGYYACAAIAGMIAGQPPQQGFTNFPITGLTGVPTTERFTRKQLNIMAGGGTYVLMQEVQGGPVFSRHQLSTDVTSVETRELSVTKIVDFTAKFLRAGIRRFIGRQNINSAFLDSIGTTIQGMLQFLVEGGVLNGAEMNNLIQDPKNPDTVMLDVTLAVPFPCNYIRLTLVV
jgi:hypothetical protein